MNALRRVWTESDSWELVQWPTRRSRAWARSLTRDPYIEALVAIGSAARGLARSGSDIDLIVVSKNAGTKRSAPPEVDARWIEANELGSRIEMGDDVFAWGVAFGVPLFDPDEAWNRLATEWRDRLPLPTRDVCLQRAKRARKYAMDLIEIGDDDAASEQVLTMLTHGARLVLSSRGVLPASRPELVDQLKRVGALELSIALARGIEGALDPNDGLRVNFELDNTGHERAASRVSSR
jgi:predicted nucleotidyltransferase